MQECVTHCEHASHFNSNLTSNGVKTYTCDIYNQLKSATGAGGLHPVSRTPS